MSRPTKTQRLKRYRRLYAEAKRKGLVKGNHDARSINPSSYMRTRLNKLEPYLNSNYSVVKVKPKFAREYRKNPSNIVPGAFNNRAIVKNEPGVIASVRKGELRGGKQIPGGYVVRKQKLKSGTYEFIPIPVDFHSYEEFEDYMRTNIVVLNAMKYENEKFAYKIGNNPSYSTYDSIEALLADFELYINDSHDREDYWLNFELFRQYQDWEWQEFREERNRSRERDRRRRIRYAKPEQEEKYYRRYKESYAYQRKKKVQREKYAKARANMTKAQIDRQNAERRKKRKDKKDK